MITIETKNLVKQFDGVRAVDEISIQIERGRITSIVGPNGSGKTTLVNLLSGVFPWSDGMVCIGEECVRHLRTSDVRGKGISRTFQQVRVFEQMTVLDNILVILTTRKLGRALIDRGSADQSACAQSALEYVGLWEKRNDLASCLSYGQRKLLEIARVIAIDPDIILFDEPFAGLFKEMVEKVVLILRELREKGKTIVLIEHNMDIIRSLSDHVIVMDGGRLLAQGRPESVLQRKEVIEAYLGE